MSNRLSYMSIANLENCYPELDSGSITNKFALLLEQGSKLLLLDSGVRQNDDNGEVA